MILPLKNCYRSIRKLWPAVSLLVAGPVITCAALDLSTYKLHLAYENDFSRPQKIAREEDFIERLPDGKWRRTGRPAADAEWIAEGQGDCEVRDGELWVTPTRTGSQTRSHMVVWNKHMFPANFLLEFDMNPCGSTNGLTIVFFCTTGKNGEDIFDPRLPPRRAEYPNYHSGALANYSDAYWSRNNEEEKISNRLRRNPGFLQIATGESRTTGPTEATRHVRILKNGGHIEVEIDGRTVVEANNPHPLGAGRIGLRSMAGVTRIAYDNFKVWEIRKRP